MGTKQRENNAIEAAIARELIPFLPGPEEVPCHAVQVDLALPAASAKASATRDTLAAATQQADRSVGEGPEAQAAEPKSARGVDWAPEAAAIAAFRTKNMLRLAYGLAVAACGANIGMFVYDRAEARRHRSEIAIKAEESESLKRSNLTLASAMKVARACHAGGFCEAGGFQPCEVCRETVRGKDRALMCQKGVMVSADIPWDPACWPDAGVGAIVGHVSENCHAGLLCSRYPEYLDSAYECIQNVADVGPVVFICKCGVVFPKDEAGAIVCTGSAGGVNADGGHL